MKRIFDLLLSLNLIVILLPIFILIFIIIKITSKGPALHLSKRVGRGNKIFIMPKFRTMRIGSPIVATHLLNEAHNYVTPIGKFMRKTSIDEIPQIFSIIVGDMSFVGPRPALFNQHDLIELRNKKGIDTLPPGITGWAQINGRDNISINEKVAFDFEYKQKKIFFFDLYILWLTLVKVIQKDGVKH